MVNNGVLGAVEKKNSHIACFKSDLVAYIDRHKAGSPIQVDLYWVSLSPRQLAQGFQSETGHFVSNRSVKNLLRELGYGYRKQHKNLATGAYAQRDEQFQIIFKLVLIMSLDSPVLSIDCKKKERLGQLYRAGKVYSNVPIQAFDHDYEHLSKGKIIPHGIYDMQDNVGYITIGKSAETAEFIADNLYWWWTNFGQKRYPRAKNMLILCDAGGGNSYRHHLFKIQLQQLSQKIGISIIIAHYPPYASKWNPIEHRLFAHVHKAIEGKPFTDYETVKNIFQTTQNQKGLTVVVVLNLKEYKTGKKATKEQVDSNKISYSKNIPELNYRIYP